MAEALIIAVLIICSAAYLGRLAWRRLRGGKACGDSCGCGAAKPAKR